MAKEAIQTNKAPKPIGIYSQAIKAGELLFVSAQLPLQPNATEIISNDPVEQIYQCFENLKNISEAAGSSLNQAVKINVYCADSKVANNINLVMEELFVEPYPARGVVKGDGFAKGARVAIEGIFSCVN